MALQVVERLRNAARLKQIAGVAIRFGFAHVVEQGGAVRRGLFRRLRRADQADPELAAMAEPERLRRMIEELGPTFVKVGQLLSTRPDVVPEWAVRELRKLQDSVAPMAFGVVRQTVETELGGSLENLFSEFATEPLAAASLGQVHRAVLPDGTVVAVKVQRPGIARQVERDLSVLHDLAELFDGRLAVVRHLRLPRIVEQLGQSLRDELVYTIEGRNAERIAQTLRPTDGVRIPKVYWHLTTPRVLTTEMFEAVPLTEAEDLPEQLRKQIAIRLSSTVLHQILVDGFFHADPHPGNVFAFPDGTVGIVDWGMVGLLSRSIRDSLGEVFISIVYQDVDRLVDEICHLGLVDDQSDLERFRRDLSRAMDRYFFLSRNEYPLGQVLSRILELSYEHHIALPSEIPMLIKVLVTTEGTCMDLDPSFELRAAFEPVVTEIVGQRLEPAQIVRDVTANLRQLNRMAQDLPRQVNSILDRMESGRMVVRQENAGLEHALQGVAGVGQRLTAALLLAALLVGGALVYPENYTIGISALSVGAAGSLILLAGLLSGR